MTVPIFDGEKIVAVVGLANRKQIMVTSMCGKFPLMNSVWSMVERKRSQFALKKKGNA